MGTGVQGGYGVILSVNTGSGLTAVGELRDIPSMPKVSPDTFNAMTHGDAGYALPTHTGTYTVANLTFVVHAALRAATIAPPATPYTWRITMPNGLVYNFQAFLKSFVPASPPKDGITATGELEFYGPVTH